jgi:uroporphyrinogen decarboxylase
MEDAKQGIDRFGKDYFVIGDCELSLFELAWHLTGLENYLVEMAAGEDWIEALNDKVILNAIEIRKHIKFGICVIFNNLKMLKMDGLE